MLNIRTLADIWTSQLTVEERLLILIDRYRAETQEPPSTPRAMGYKEAVDNIEYFVLEKHPLPPEDFA